MWDIPHSSPDAAAIHALAGVFRSHARGEKPAPSGPLESAYAGVLARLGDRKLDVAGALRDAAFRPYFLLNGLLCAAHQSPDESRYTVRALVCGLEQFAPYFAMKFGTAGGVPKGAEMEAQHRYLGFLVAQLPECGMGFDGVLATMKADSLDLGTAYEVRTILEEGPEALLRSSLFDEADRVHWRKVFDGAPGAREALRDHLARSRSFALEPRSLA